MDYHIVAAGNLGSRLNHITHQDYHELGYHGVPEHVNREQWLHDDLKRMEIYVEEGTYIIWDQTPDIEERLANLVEFLRYFNIRAIVSEEENIIDYVKIRIPDMEYGDGLLIETHYDLSPTNARFRMYELYPSYYNQVYICGVMSGSIEERHQPIGPWSIVDSKNVPGLGYQLSADGISPIKRLDTSDTNLKWDIINTPISFNSLDTWSPEPINITINIPLREYVNYIMDQDGVVVLPSDLHVSMNYPHVSYSEPNIMDLKVVYPAEYELPSRHLVKYYSGDVIDNFIIRAAGPIVLINHFEYIKSVFDDRFTQEDYRRYLIANYNEINPLYVVSY